MLELQSASPAQGDEVDQILNLSTAHLHREDVLDIRSNTQHVIQSGEFDSHEWHELLFPGGFLIPLSGGWLLRVFADHEPSPDEPVPFSEHFMALLNWARQEGFGWLRFDRDAPERLDLPTFPE